MKRATIAGSILLASGIVWTSSQRQTDHLSYRIGNQQASLSEHQQALSHLRDQVEVAEARSTQVRAVLDSLRQEAEHISPEVLGALAQLRTGALKELPDNWRSILGGSWDASSTYVLIPKDSVAPAFSHTTIRRGDEWFGMTPFAVAALGLKTEQADWIGHWGTNLVASAKEWVQESFQRGETGDGVLFRYVIPPSSAGFNRMVERYNSVLAAEIGADRAKLVNELLLVGHRLLPSYVAVSGIELTVSRNSEGKLVYQYLERTVFSKPSSDPHRPKVYRETGEISSSDQHLPRVLPMLVPGGWGSVLSQEGIALPNDK